jgi:multimeric flavodoxin WrbA
MKIVVLKGSPNINGSSNLLAKNFIDGAMES